MKKIFIVIAFMSLLSPFLVAQNSDIALDEIWASGKFSADYVWGQRSMSEGKHYTTFEGGKIIQNAYSTGAEVAVIFDPSNFTVEKLNVSD
ncbi:MAG: hypothetical protein QNK63_09455 [Flavobacteriales bacterium]